MTKDNEDALRCADVLRQLDGAKKYHPSGPGGQMLGCESYRLIASGFSFGEMQTAADHLQRLVAENEAKDALLRQAVEALEEITPYFPGDDKTRDAALASIYQHLEGKA